MQLNDITTASKEKALMKTLSLSTFKDQIDAMDGWGAVQQALNLDEGNDPEGLQTSQVGRCF